MKRILMAAVALLMAASFANAYTVKDMQRELDRSERQFQRDMDIDLADQRQRHLEQRIQEIEEAERAERYNRPPRGHVKQRKATTTDYVSAGLQGALEGFMEDNERKRIEDAEARRDYRLKRERAEEVDRIIETIKRKRD